MTWIGVTDLLLGCARLSAVDGQVVNSLDGSPLSGVSVSVVGTTNTEITGVDGQYHLEAIVPGPQNISATKDGYVMLAEVVLLTGAGQVTQATNLQMLPRPPSPGLYQRSEGRLEPLPPFPEQMLDIFLAPRNGHAILVSSAPAIPTVEGPIELILWTPEGAPVGLDFAVLPVTLKADSRSRYFGPLPPHYTFGGTTVPLSLDTIGSGFTKIRVDAKPGIYAAKRTHVAGVGDWFYLFEVPPPNAEAVPLPSGEGRGLRVAIGEYKVLSQQWTVARDLVNEWCASSRAPDCPAVSAALLQPNAGGYPGCQGKLTVASTTATISSWSCNGGDFAAFSKDGDLFRVERVWLEEAGD